MAKIFQMEKNVLSRDWSSMVEETFFVLNSVRNNHYCYRMVIMVMVIMVMVMVIMVI